MLLRSKHVIVPCSLQLATGIDSKLIPTIIIMGLWLSLVGAPPYPWVHNAGDHLQATPQMIIARIRKAHSGKMRILSNCRWHGIAPLLRHVMCCKIMHSRKAPFEPLRLLHYANMETLIKKPLGMPHCKDNGLLLNMSYVIPRIEYWRGSIAGF